MIRVEQRRIAVSVVQDGTTVQVSPSVSRPVVAPAILQVRVSSAGQRGLPGDGSGMTVGPGLKIVGNEIRYDIESLTRG